MEQQSVEWRGDNEDEVFDFARPCVFQDYTDPGIPMRLRSKSGALQRLVRVGDSIVKKDDGSFEIERGAKA